MAKKILSGLVLCGLLVTISATLPVLTNEKIKAVPYLPNFTNDRPVSFPSGGGQLYKSAGMAVDSAGNQYTLISSTTQGISWGGAAQGGFVCIVNRDFTDIDALNYHRTKDLGVTWRHNNKIFAEKTTAPRYPNAHAGPNNPYAFFPKLIPGPAFGMAYGIYGSGGYSSDTWDPAVNVGGTDAKVSHVLGFVTEDGNVLVIGGAGDGSTNPYQIPYWVCFGDLSLVLNNGYALADYAPYFAGCDYNGGKAAVLILDDAMGGGYTESVDNGNTWSDFVPTDPFYYMSIDTTGTGISGYSIIYGLNMSMALDDEGKHVIAECVMDNRSWGSGDINPDQWPPMGAINVIAPNCPKLTGDTVLARRIDIDQYDDSTTIYPPSYVVWPQVATGTIAGKKMIMVTWLQTDGTTTGVDTKWDIRARVSSDNGNTWGPIKKVTDTPNISEGCQQLAKRIDTIKGYGHILYAEAQDDNSTDIECRTALDEQMAIRIMYANTKADVGVAENGTTETPVFALTGSYPNPFVERTTISYQIPAAGRVLLAVYDVSGREVKTLVDARESAGMKRVTWDGRDANGQPVPEGIYFYTLQLGTEQATGKILLVR